MYNCTLACYTQKDMQSMFVVERERGEGRRDDKERKKDIQKFFACICRSISLSLSLARALYLCVCGVWSACN